MLVAAFGAAVLDVESAVVAADAGSVAGVAAAEDAETAADAAVDVAEETDLKLEVDPNVVGVAAVEFPLFPVPVELEVLPAIKEFKLAKFVFPKSRFAMAAPKVVGAKWLFGS